MLALPNNSADARTKRLSTETPSSWCLGSELLPSGALPFKHDKAFVYNLKTGSVEESDFFSRDSRKSNQSDQIGDFQHPQKTTAKYGLRSAQQADT